MYIPRLSSHSTLALHLTSRACDNSCFSYAMYILDIAAVRAETALEDR